MEPELNNKFNYPRTNLSFVDSQRRKLCFRNERSLYTRVCDGTGDRIISVYAPNSPYKVYKSDYWYGDDWDPLDYGRGFDFSRPFFEQYAELQKDVPRLALSNVHGVNSDYCNMTFHNKNCYLVFGGDFNEDCMFGTLGMYNKNTFDCDYSNSNILCYEICDCMKCYACNFALDSQNCSSCYFISNCTGCSDCILCTNLVQKKYCIENKQLSKEQYLDKKKEIINGSYEKQKQLLEKFQKIQEKRIVKYSHLVNCTNCTGDYQKNSKNCINSYDISNSEDIENTVFASKAKDCMDCSLIGDGSQLCYQTMSTINAFNIALSFFTIDSSNIEYSEFSINSNDLFGCISLRNKKYCILNKQYSKEEYTDLKHKIISHMKKTGEWGEYFPPNLSCFPYNESSAHDYFPLKKEEAIAKGYKWRDKETLIPKPQSFQLPDNIEETDRTIIGEILQCKTCNKNYKILEKEFKFYSKTKTSIPRNCPDCRHKKRMSQRNPREIIERKCDKCGADIKTTYAPSRPETVYCEKCYLEEVY